MATRPLLRARMFTSTVGSGATLTLTTAAPGGQTFANGGALNGDTIEYFIEDGSPAVWEVSTGTYTSAGTTLGRTLVASSTGSLLSLSGNAVVTGTIVTSDLIINGGPNTLATGNGGTGLSAFTSGVVFYAASTSALGASNIQSNGSQISINGAPVASTQFLFSGTAPSSGALTYGNYVNYTIPATTTTQANSYLSTPSTAASAFTLGALQHFAVIQGTIGAGSAVTNQYGFTVASTMTGATNNYGFYSGLASATGVWAFYNAGTSSSFLGGPLGMNTTPSGGWIQIGAGTATRAEIVLTSGTNLTTAAAGSVEYDGTCLYFTPFSTARSVVLEEQLVVLGTAYTLTSQTAAQKLFNATANGAVTLPLGTYQFECMFSLSSMSSTSGSFGFALGVGTAVIGSQGWIAFAQKGTATLATATAEQVTYNTAANTALATASANTVGYAYIKGFFRVTTAGTVIPQVSLGVAAAAIVGVQSFFKVSPVSSTNAAATNISVGNWS